MSIVTAHLWALKNRLKFIVLLFIGLGAVLPSGASAQTFSDVPTDYWAYSFIETLSANGITAGCGGGKYCPGDTVSRAQMAVFLERGIRGPDYAPFGGSGDIFDDVAADDFAAGFIEQLYLDGITAGCGNNNYCPNAVVSRAQMAVLLLRAEHGAGYSPPAATGIFGDVDLNHWAVHWIEQLAAEDITAGCGSGNYCPEATVTRDQMAVFLVRTFNLVMPQTSGLELLSRSATGEVGFLASTMALTTSQGRFVVFRSEASNLVPNDSNGMFDVFLVDRTAGSIERVSLSTNGDEAIANSGQSNAQFHFDVSPDGRFVLFQSSAGNLVPDDTNGRSDLFLRDRQLGTTTWVNLMSGGVEFNDDSGEAVMTPDANYVVFAGNHGAAQNTIFWRDLVNDVTIEAVETVDGEVPNGQIFHMIFDGPDQIIFTSSASNLVANDTNDEIDGFIARIDVVNRTVANVERLPIGLSGVELDGETRVWSGRVDCFAFTTNARNMIPSIPTDLEQLYLQHTLTGQTVVEHVSIGISGGPSNAKIVEALVNEDCDRVVFNTKASNLVDPSDTNGKVDVYAAEAPSWEAIRLSLNEDGTESSLDAYISLGSILTDLDYVVFIAFGPLVSEDNNGVQDVYGVPFP